jgi:micrococcal nuclease
MRLPETKIGWSLVLIGATSLVVSLMQGREPLLPRTVSQGESSARTPCRVLTVYDGDTLGCDLNRDGRIERPEEEIRLLGIDTPEMHYSHKNPTYGTAHPQDEPFAPQASRWMETHAEHKTVYLEFDRRRQDKYGRTLAYVYPGTLDPVSLNEGQLAEGYATILFIGQNRLHEQRFRQVEALARQRKLGVWQANDTFR